MNKEQFNEYLHSPEKLKNIELSELTLMVNDFPFCATIRIFKTLKLYIDKNVLFESDLKTTAIFSGSRKILKRHIDRLSKEKTRIFLPDEEKPIKNTKTKINEKKPLSPKIKIINEEKSGKKNTENKIENQITKNNPIKSKTLNQTEIKSIKQKNIPNKKLITSDRKLSLEELKKIVEDRIRAIEKENREKKHKTEKNKPQPKTTDDIIETFIRNNPSISRPTISFYDPMELAKESVVDKENIVSETLAKIYMDQGNYQKAIQIFNKLSLKFPEKSSYFAALIKKAKNNLEN